MIRSGGVSWRLTRCDGARDLDCANGGLCGGYLCEEDDALKVVVGARKRDMIHGGDDLRVWNCEEDDARRWWRFCLEVAVVVVCQVLCMTTAIKVKWWLWVVSTTTDGGLGRMVVLLCCARSNDLVTATTWLTTLDIIPASFLFEEENKKLSESHEINSTSEDESKAEASMKTIFEINSHFV
ncbi:uncharacterized protein HKW66_Vig0082740 [Vigna angularis]|uniref:Uncharacterized protein n=1 Tax=Phaseolus angularis TaxID=3914 RepID=A0A8T0KHV4_PHAAN|nr:uncharacterized protein HKW66_Vig0082740 [Vigna angularis]